MQGFNNISLFVEDRSEFDTVLAGSVKMADGSEYWVNLKLSSGLPDEIVEDLKLLLGIAQQNTINRRPLFYGNLKQKRKG
jgi:hypothetical protein